MGITIVLWLILFGGSLIFSLLGMMFNSDKLFDRGLQGLGASGILAILGITIILVAVILHG